jgi:type III restriction enzyme
MRITKKMELFPFQIKASTQIADRFYAYAQDPLAITRTRTLPFYQNLSSITGSGKTVILADAVEQIRSRLPIEPIVLWLSKGRVVVWQTYANLSSGKYAGLLGGYQIKPLLDCNSFDVADSSRGLLLVATVGKFNQKDKDQGDRRIFRVAMDVADRSLWDLLTTRRDQERRRRPFIVVYDEGHNLSDQQTELLLELEPDALIAASATPRIPEALANVIQRLREDKKWKDPDLVTTIKSTDVVACGLVKRHIMLGGYVTPMEHAIDDLLSTLKKAEDAAERLGVGLRPKAIYVSTTNTVDGASIRDDAARPFADRKARPILIWRHLIEHGHVNPADIAVYCNLKFEPKLPPPPSFNLFAGGDGDYDRFVAGGFRHIIFNLSLQEGWDDPECSFAYIDKEMGSPDQVTQIIGRALRQPSAQHYAAPLLNTASFYIRTDEKGIIEAIIDDVRLKLASEFPDISLSVSRSYSRNKKATLDPKKKWTIPLVSVDSSNAKGPIDEIIRRIPNYQNNSNDTLGEGERIQVLQTIGKGVEAREEWVQVEHSNRVTARWVFLRELQKRRRKAAHLCDIELAKFDALVEYNSPAAAVIREAAEKITEAYAEHSVIVQNANDNPYEVGPVSINAKSRLVNFRNAVHQGYSESDLNPLERKFAEALDKSKKPWCRNPSRGGFEIPLLDRGATKTFNPDFLVWGDKRVVAIDTKGDHLIVEDAGRKLLYIETVGDGSARLEIRLVTLGKWQAAGQIARLARSPGYTVWALKNGKPHPTFCNDVAKAVQTCITG